MGNWSEQDKFHVATLKLVDHARAFYNGNLELHEPNVTWAAFQKRFRDVRTDQYHFTQLQMARQKSSETPQEFAVRCRSLAQRTVPQVENQELQKLYYEQAERMLLSSFTSGLLGNAGKQVRYALPRTLEEALKIAITVDQADLQERRSEAFYLRSQEQESGSAGRSPSETNHRDSGRARTQYSAGEHTEARSSRNY